MTLTEAVRCVAHCVTFAGLPRGAAPVRVIGAIPNGPAWRCHAILGSGSANHAPASRSNQRLWYVRSRGNQCSTRSSSGARVITPTGPEDCRALIMSSPDQPSTTGLCKDCHAYRTRTTVHFGGGSASRGVSARCIRKCAVPSPSPHARAADQCFHKHGTACKSGR